MLLNYLQILRQDARRRVSHLDIMFNTEKTPQYTYSQSGVQIKVSRYLAQQLYHMIKFNFKIKSLPNVYVSRVLCLTHLTLDMDTRSRYTKGVLRRFPPQEEFITSRFHRSRSIVVGTTTYRIQLLE